MYFRLVESVRRWRFGGGLVFASSSVVQTRTANLAAFERNCLIRQSLFGSRVCGLDINPLAVK